MWDESKFLLQSIEEYLNVLRKGSSLSDISEREIGDELVSERPYLMNLGKYTHHGIYIGNGRVIHYSGLSNNLLNKGKIEETSLKEFCNGQKSYVRRYFNPKFSGNDVVERAKSRLGEDRYHVFDNNCEHFSTWCITGEAKSPQGKNAKQSTYAAFGMAGIAILASIFLAIGSGAGDGDSI